MEAGLWGRGLVRWLFEEEEEMAAVVSKRRRFCLIWVGSGNTGCCGQQTPAEGIIWQSAVRGGHNVAVVSRINRRFFFLF